MIHQRLSNHVFLISLALLGLSVSSVNAAILNVDGDGNLLGASGVDVGGELYDVEFLDGTCVDLFDGCNSQGDFQFASVTSAQVAGLALLAQVFIDGPAGNFDSNPGQVSGCTAGSYTCVSLIPYAPDSSSLVLTVAIHNKDTTAPDHYAFPQSVVALADLTQFPTTNYARFSPGLPAVPVPAAVWLFGTALIGLAGFSKRKSKVAV
jgi:hypothetical protein